MTNKNKKPKSSRTIVRAMVWLLLIIMVVSIFSAVIPSVIGFFG